MKRLVKLLSVFIALVGFSIPTMANTPEKDSNRLFSFMQSNGFELIAAPKISLGFKETKMSKDDMLARAESVLRRKDFTNVTLDSQSSSATGVRSGCQAVIWYTYRLGAVFFAVAGDGNVDKLCDEIIDAF